MCENISSSNSVYSPLPGNDYIRLVRIRSVAPEADVRLSCTIKTVQLGQACPEYVALSYTWGSPLKDRLLDQYEGARSRISISLTNENGIRDVRQIGRNLYEALDTLHTLLDSDRYVWADDICINQSDLEEKSTQVRQMGTIFSSAYEVNAFLGRPDPDDTYDDVAALASLSKQLSLRYNKHRHERLQCIDPLTVSIGDTSSTLTWRQLASLERFCGQRRLFRRAWAFQELMGTNRPVVLLLASVRVNFDDLQAFLRWFRKSCGRNGADLDPLLGNFRLQFVALSQGIPVFWDLCTARYEHLSYVESIQSNHLDNCNRADLPHEWTHSQAIFGAWFTKMMHFTTKLEAANPRDLVFAYLHHASEALPAGSKAPMEPDYTLSVGQLYCKLTAIMLSSSRISQVFRLLPALSLRSSSGMPSWVFNPSLADHQRFPLHIESTLKSKLEAKFRKRQRRFVKRNSESPDGKFVCSLCVQTHCRSFFVKTSLRKTPSVLDAGGRRLKVLGGRCDEITSSQQCDDKAISDFAVIRLATVKFILETCLEFAPMYFNGTGIFQAISEVWSPWSVQKSRLRARDGEFIRTLESYLVSAAAIARSKEDPDIIQKVDLTRLITTLEDCFCCIDALNGLAGLHKRQDIIAASKDMNPASSIAFMLNDRHPQFYQHQYDSMIRTKAACFGITEAEAQPGDQLWLLGCVNDSPVVLRPTSKAEDEFQVIGTAYVHGAMQGEYLRRGLVERVRQITLV